MLISASVHDDVIPFDGVEKYVSKLKDCVSIHQKKSRSCDSITSITVN